jgi:Acetyltransferase (GNAT) domain
MKWTLHDLDRFGAYSAAWDEVNKNGADLPILDAMFFELLFRVSAPKNAVLALCDDGNGTLAATIVKPAGFGKWQTYQPSQAPLGAWVQREGSSIRQLLESLSRSLRSCLLLSASQLDPDIVARPPGDHRLHALDYIDVARLTIAGSFDEYWAARGKNLRKNMKRQQNLLERESISTSFEWITDPADAARVVGDYGILESQGWKSSLGTAIHPDNAQGEFYRSLMKHYMERGQGLVTRFLYDNSLVATDLCLHRGGVLVLLKTTYDERQQTTSPSYLMRLEVMKRLFNDEATSRIEFYGRIMEWHTKWSSEFRRLYHLNYFRYPATGRLYSLRNALRKALAAEEGAKAQTVEQTYGAEVEVSK